jgi:hypothetical protein
MSGAAEAETAWRAFMTEPVSYIDPGQFSRALGGALSVELCARLRDCERLQGRLSTLILAGEGLNAWGERTIVSEEDAAIAAAPLPVLTAIVQRAGAIFWAAGMVNAVRGADVAALQNALGEEVCRFALKHRDLAGPEQPLAPFETLGERVLADGWLCYAGWCDSLPSEIRARARLKISAGDAQRQPAPPAFLASGPAIIRRAAT